jgi:hypothetical protein
MHPRARDLRRQRPPRRNVYYQRIRPSYTRRVAPRWRVEAAMARCHARRGAPGPRGQGIPSEGGERMDNGGARQSQ